jgi:UDP:flavonoid glycosyltransferase YjiC (YdhE family)
MQYQPPEDLKQFLAAGEPPVYIGFGSMTLSKAKAGRLPRDMIVMLPICKAAVASTNLLDDADDIMAAKG